MKLEEALDILRGSIWSISNPCFQQAQLNEIADYLERLQKERDAAVADLKELGNIYDSCYTCKYSIDDCCMNNNTCTYGSNKWEWRGVQEEEQ